MSATMMDMAQGSPEWHRHRAASCNASDLAAVMGLSSYTTRAELIRQKALGIIPEIDAETQRRFDRGHEYEALARPWAEEIIGEELYPVTLSADHDGLPLSASVDGITLAEHVTWEHKTLNAALAAALDAGEIPEEYRPQMEQGLLISGASRCLFMASSGDRETMRYAWYEPDPALRAKILPTWRQFLEDVQNYQHVEHAPAPEGRAPETLPALRIEVKGMVAASNLAEFQQHAMAVINGISTDLQTDEDFASAEKTVKWCSEVERRLEDAKAAALSQTADIDDLFRTIDSIREETRSKRLSLDKAVKARKESIRAEIVQSGKRAIEDHCAALEAGLGVSLPRPDCDFAGAIKGKKLLSAMRDAVDTALAHAKIAANETAERIRTNLATLAAHPDHRFLFADLQSIIDKPAEDFSALVKVRINEHQADEAAKEQVAKAAREAEEQARKAREEQAKQAEQERIEREKREAAERIERAEREKQEAEERAARAAQEAEERVRREAEAQAQREREEAERRERNQKHRGKIHSEAAAALIDSGISENDAKKIVMLIAEGKVPHVSIAY